MVKVEDVIRIPPHRFNEPVEKVALEELRRIYVDMHDEDLGCVIAVVDAEVDPVGKILPGDGASYNRVRFTLLVFKPERDEIVEGDVVSTMDFGAFVRIGPIDALLHKSQIMDDYVVFDRRGGFFMGKQSGKKLGEGDHVRVKVTAVSFKRETGLPKVAVTARAAYLGKLEWIRELVSGGGEEGASKEGLVERACRDCKMITTRSRCPNCGSDRLSKDFSGIIIVMDPERSEVAKILNIRKPGMYALRVR